MALVSVGVGEIALKTGCPGATGAYVHEYLTIALGKLVVLPHVRVAGSFRLIG